MITSALGVASLVDRGALTRFFIHLHNLPATVYPLPLRMELVPADPRAQCRHSPVTTLLSPGLHPLLQPPPRPLLQHFQNPTNKTSPSTFRITTQRRTSHHAPTTNYPRARTLRALPALGGSDLFLPKRHTA
jgi:hypothetical protein